MQNKNNISTSEESCNQNITSDEFLNRFLELHTQDDDDIIDRQVYVKEYTAKRQTLLQSIEVTRRLELTIEKINKELLRMISQVTPKPKTFSGSDDIWFDIQEQRHEHLTNFMMLLTFIRENPNQEMTI